jgi:type VI secretion system ImpM family protein
MTAPGFTGKLPSRGDFVDRGLPPGQRRVFEDWASSLMATVAEGGGASTDAFDRMAPWCFQIGHGVPVVGGIAGVVLPSRDSVGRRAPLIAAGPASPDGAPGWFAAAALELGTLIEDAGPPDAVAEVLALLGPPPDAVQPDGGAWWPLGSTTAIHAPPGLIPPHGLPDLLSRRMPATGRLSVPDGPVVTFRSKRSSLPGSRGENQDADRGDDERGLWVVCDGVGGEAGGAEAARLVADALLRLDLPQDADGREDAVLAALERLHAEPAARGHGKTTVVAAMATDAGLRLVWVGDSRAYLVDGERFEPLTRDHSLVQLRVDRGELTPAEAAVHPARNVLLQAVGQEGVGLDPGRADVVVRRDQTVLLCTDGVHGVLPAATLAALVRHPDAAAAVDAIAEAVEQAGAPDNHTVCLLRCGAAPRRFVPLGPDGGRRA